MKTKNIVILFLSFLISYFLVIFQNSFLVHFAILGTVPNMVLISICLISFFEKPSSNIKFYSALMSGLLIDVYSNFFIGVSILIFIAIALIFKKSIKSFKNVSEKHPFRYFLPLFIICLALYKLFLIVVSIFCPGQFFQAGFDFFTLVFIVYNIAVASIIFYVYKISKFLKTR